MWMSKFPSCYVNMHNGNYWISAAETARGVIRCSEGIISVTESVNHMMCLKKKNLENILVLSIWDVLSHALGIFLFNKSAFWQTGLLYIYSIYYYRGILAALGILASPGQHNLLVDVSQIPNVCKIAMLARQRKNYKLSTIKPRWLFIFSCP